MEESEAVMNNNIYISPSSGKDRVDPESSKTKSVKTASGQNFRKILDKDKEGDPEGKVKDSTDISDLSEEKIEHSVQENEPAEDRVFSLFARPPKVRTTAPLKAPPTLLRQDAIANAEIEAPPEDFEESDSFADVEKTEPEGYPEGSFVESEEPEKKVEPAAVPVEKPHTTEKLGTLYSPVRHENNEQLNVVKESPEAVFAKNRKLPVRVNAKDDSVNIAQLLPVKSKKEKNEGNPFPQEHIDLSRVGTQGIPPVVPIESVSITPSEKPVPVVSTDMQLLIDQLLKEISVVTKGDKTETTLILKHPPLFDGAHVVITGFGSAQGEFNIAFGNLTQNAQTVVQQQQQNLLMALEAKGYYVHIFTATTVDVQPILLSEGQVPNQKQQQREGQGGREKEEKTG